ncbi:MAG TPA: hypothetical protein VGE38_07375 [Nocardioides sp.]|uniref:hypothetical protein n=1 Tax=Nocardioides sp. TaxID=35761 RepID=UPI002ED87678
MDPSHITRAGIVLPVRVDSTGVDGPKYREIATSRWRACGGGWHVPSSVEPTREQRIVEAACAMPTTGAVTGWAGLAWGGGRYFPGVTGGGRLLDVPVALDNRRRIRPRPGVELCEEFLKGEDIEVLDGLPITRHERSVCRLLRTTANLEERVRVLDMAAFDDLCSPQEVLDYAVLRLAGRPHVSRIWQAVPLADENAWSPAEVALRMEWRAQVSWAGLVTNAPLFDLAGNHLATPDLIDPRAGVVGEYNGAEHDEEGRAVRDLDREERYRDHGLEPVVMIGMTRRSRAGFAARLRSAYERAARRRTPATWTLEHPDWWVDTSRVQLRRALTDAQRSVWLKR